MDHRRLHPPVASEPGKGHREEELRRFGDAVAEDGPTPIPIDEIMETSAVALHVEDLLFGRFGADDDK